MGLALGVVGSFVPLLPTVPFLILAAWALGRANPRFELWLLAHPRLGPPLVRWRAGGVIGRRAKWLAAIGIALSAALLLLAEPLELRVAGWVALAVVLLYVGTRPEEPEEPPAP